MGDVGRPTPISLFDRITEGEVDAGLVERLSGVDDGRELLLFVSSSSPSLPFVPLYVEFLSTVTTRYKRIYFYNILNIVFTII
jgi:hypothetical protein